MALVDLVRGGVALVNAITKSGGLQESVTYEAWLGQTGAGVDDFDTPVVLMALVDRTQKPHEVSSGVLLAIVATLDFLDPIPYTAPRANQPRLNPVDPRDRFTLFDGVTGPTIVGGGFEDAGLHRPFVNTVRLGA
jgi:hypothetical protein